jgi:hypothetical protein
VSHKLVMTRQVRDWLHALRVAGDKSGRRDQWYRDAIPAAEAAYEAYLQGRGQR